jgi:hypothetical protein
VVLIIYSLWSFYSADVFRQFELLFRCKVLLRKPDITLADSAVDGFSLPMLLSELSESVFPMRREISVRSRSGFKLLQLCSSNLCHGGSKQNIWDHTHLRQHTSPPSFAKTSPFLGRLQFYFGFIIAYLCVSAHLWGVYLVFASLDTTQHWHWPVVPLLGQLTFFWLFYTSYDDLWHAVLVRITRAWKHSSSMKSFSEDSMRRPMTLGEATKTCFSGTRAPVQVVPMDASTHFNSENR